MRFGLFGRPGRAGSHDPGSGSGSAHSVKKKSEKVSEKSVLLTVKKVLKPLVAAVAVVSAPVTAFAGIGSGGSGVSGNTGVGPAGDILYLADDNDYADTSTQGWDDDSITYMLNALSAAGYDFMPDAEEKITSACQTAISEAIADTSNGVAEHARVIGLAATIADGTNNRVSTWGTNTSDFRSRFESNWSALGVLLLLPVCLVVRFVRFVRGALL